MGDRNVSCIPCLTVCINAVISISACVIIICGNHATLPRRDRDVTGTRVFQIQPFFLGSDLTAMGNGNVAVTAASFACRKNSKLIRIY